MTNIPIYSLLNQALIQINEELQDYDCSDFV